MVDIVAKLGRQEPLFWPRENNHIRTRKP
jgi:hypothetical protein